MLAAYSGPKKHAVTSNQAIIQSVSILESHPIPSNRGVKGGHPERLDRANHHHMGKSGLFSLY